MAFKIGIYNRKGGVGKTHGTINIGACLAMKGYRVLLVDADSQCNLSSFFFGSEDAGIFNYDLGVRSANDSVTTLYDVLECRDNIYNAIFSTKEYTLRRKIQSKFKKISFKLDVIIGDSRMDEVDVENIDYVSSKLEMLDNEYDFILIDFAPAFTNLVTVYMAACNAILVPAKLGESASMEGYFDVLYKVDGVRNAKFNDSLYVMGLYYTMAQDYKKNQRAQYNETYDADSRPLYNLFDSYIHLDYAANVLSHEKGEPFIVCAPGSKCSKDYISLTDEIINKIEHPVG